LKKTKFISFLILILIIGCKSQQGIDYSKQNRFEFDYFNTKDIFEIEILQFQRNTASCGTEGLPYALLIGKTKSESLPEKVTVLSYCDDRIFRVGDKLKIEPTENPTKKTTMNPIYFVKDSIINGEKMRWLLGSENKTIWGRPILKEKDCKLNNGKYKVIYDEQFSDYPKFEFEVNGIYLTEINSDSNRKFKIDSIGENNFRLKSMEKQTDSLTEFQKRLTSNGKPYYEITGCKKDTIEFIMRVNLHVISHSGKFVRID